MSLPRDSNIHNIFSCWYKNHKKRLPPEVSFYLLYLFIRPCYNHTVMKKALFLGILGSLFFAFTFIFNRSMNLGGGYWMWSACLRYIFTLPLMAILLIKGNGFRPVFRSIKKSPSKWFIWSTVGFGLFYLPLTAASIFGESWFVAATWQVTIVCGVILTPLFGKKIPFKNLLCAALILLGIFLLQTSHFNELNSTQVNIIGLKIPGIWVALILILIAAFSYPLGNRKMMEIVPEGFGTTQRVFGMTLCSMPFWIIFSIIALIVNGLPSAGQALQSFIVALFSGVIATLLFFEATNTVRSNARQLAVIEATQCGEVIFTLIGGILFLGDPLPSALGFIGIAVIIAGMTSNSLLSGK